MDNNYFKLIPKEIIIIILRKYITNKKTYDKCLLISKHFKYVINYYVKYFIPILLENGEIYPRHLLHILNNINNLNIFIERVAYIKILNSNKRHFISLLHDKKINIAIDKILETDIVELFDFSKIKTNTHPLLNFMMSNNKRVEYILYKCRYYNHKLDHSKLMYSELFNKLIDIMHYKKN